MTKDQSFNTGAAMSDLALFAPYLQKWKAQPDGAPFSTHAGHLLPVRLDGPSKARSAMIKIALHIDERIGAQVMNWWGGDGAARIYAHDEAAGVLLMERATGPRRLLDMALQGEDDAATSIVCHTIARLHVGRPSQPPEELLPLKDFFASLAPMARREGGLMAECEAVADELLSQHSDRVVLHGDAHHNNILDFGERGWLAIDPKRVVGDRYYDYVGVLCNPELETCTHPPRFGRQVDVVASTAKLERGRLLRWVMAHAALSAAWFLEDGERDQANNELEVASLARQALN